MSEPMTTEERLNLPKAVGKSAERRLIATLEEHPTFSLGGGIALFLLLIFQFGMVLAFNEVKSAVQEASIGTVWIAGNILLATGVIVGRRRNYRVLSEP